MSRQSALTVCADNLKRDYRARLMSCTEARSASPKTRTHVRHKTPATCVTSVLLVFVLWNSNRKRSGSCLHLFRFVFVSF